MMHNNDGPLSVDNYSRQGAHYNCVSWAQNLSQSDIYVCTSVLQIVKRRRNEMFYIVNRHSSTIADIINLCILFRFPSLKLAFDYKL
jgi:hypothetical protein